MSGASGSGSRMPATRNRRSPSQTAVSGVDGRDAEPLRRRPPEHRHRQRAVASLRNTPLAIVPSSAFEQVWSGRPSPRCRRSRPRSTKLVAPHRAPSRVATEDTCCTGSMRATIFSAARSAASLAAAAEASGRPAPAAGSCRAGRAGRAGPAWLEREMPSTATIAAMPIAMPSADSAARSAAGAQAERADAQQVGEQQAARAADRRSCRACPTRSRRRASRPGAASPPPRRGRA